MNTREILWYSTTPDMLRITTISIGSRRIFITYADDAIHMVRTVLDIEIYRR
jgi:hypothetical protein